MVWISVNTAAELLEITSRAVRKNCLQNAYTVQTVESVGGRSGLSYQIDLASLPAEAQARYWQQASAPTSSASGGATAPTSSATGSVLPRQAQQPEAPRLQENLNATNRAILNRNLEIVEYFNGLAGKKLASALIRWNLDHSEAPLNKRTLYRIMQKYREGGAADLAGKYGKTKGTSTITEEWFNVFLKAYAIAGSPTSIKACREVVRGYAIQHGQITEDGEFPSADSFRRRLNRVDQQTLTMLRSGLDAWKTHHSYSIDVDRESIACGEIYVADHAKFDCLVSTQDGKLVRPWLSAMCDYKSRMIVGYELFLDEPNGNHIIIVMKRSFESHGVPRMLLFDNGKDYRRKDISEGRSASSADLVAGHVPTISQLLGIEVKFAIPYNSQTKPIERVFGIFRQYFDKFMPAYVGSDGKKRPDQTRKLELDWAKAQRSGQEMPEKLPVLQFDKFKALAEEFIEIYNHRVFENGKMKGLSPVGIWQKEAPAKRSPRPDELALLCTSCGAAVRVVRNVLRDTRSGYRYWAPWMAKWDGSKQLFFVRVDPERPDTAYCFQAEETKKGLLLGKFAGTAELQPAIGLYDDSEEGRAALARQMEIKNSVRRYAKRELKRVVGEPMSADEMMSYMHTSVTASHNSACTARGITFEDPLPPSETVHITRFSGVRAEIERSEHAGILTRDHYKYIEEEQHQTEKPQIVRFRRIDNHESED